MNSRNQIKTHFDSNIIIFFLFFFIFSCGLLAFKSSNEEKCLVSEFTVEGDSFEEGAILIFSDSSSQSYSWKWNFGDGNDVSHKSKVVHAYKKPGVYKVKLLVNNSCNLEKSIKIIAKKKADIKPTAAPVKLAVNFTVPDMVYKGEQIHFFDKTANARSWQWKFNKNDDSSSDLKNPKHTYNSIGLKTVTLIVNGDEKNALSKEINVIERKDKIKVKKTVESTPEPLVIEKPVVKVEDKTITENEIGELIYIISKGKLTYDGFKNNFCKDQVPMVQINNKAPISLEAFYEQASTKRFKTKSIKVKKENNKCVSLILIKV